MDEVSLLRAEVKRLGRIQLVLVVVVAALATYTLMTSLPGQPPPRLAVSELTLVADDGTVRARLGTEGLGDAQLTLSDTTGKERVWLKAGDQHGTVEITDAARHTLARLSAVENQSALRLANGAGHQTAAIQASTENASVTVVDLDRSLYAELRADPAGTELELSRNPVGKTPGLASLSAGPVDGPDGAALVLAGPRQFVKATVNPDDEEPRIVLAGETRLESRTAATGEPWQRFDRPTPEPGMPIPALPPTP